MPSSSDGKRRLLADALRGHLVHRYAVHVDVDAECFADGRAGEETDSLT